MQTSTVDPHTATSVPHKPLLYPALASSRLRRSLVCLNCWPLLHVICFGVATTRWIILIRVENMTRFSEVSHGDASFYPFAIAASLIKVNAHNLLSLLVTLRSLQPHVTRFEVRHIKTS